MTLDEYQLRALATCSELCRGSLFYSVAGIAGEAGEFCDAVKKAQFHNKPADEMEARVAQLMELGDLLWMIAQATDAIAPGMGLNALAQLNLDKLARRHGKKYNQKHYEGEPSDG